MKSSTKVLQKKNKDSRPVMFSMMSSQVTIFNCAVHNTKTKQNLRGQLSAMVSHDVRGGTAR